MATILLSAAGAALGGAVGGTVAGLSTAAVGRALGATLGQTIDARLLGTGSAPVETGRVDRFRLTQASEGTPIAQVYGRVRIGGQVIWASRFLESTSQTGGGKGGSGPRTTHYSYSVSLAVALCEGEITAIPRVWADGEEVSVSDLNMTIYRGTQTQQPDPVLEAIEGAGRVPAFRGTAYVVMENLELAPFGNRVPQFSFEVIRAEQPQSADYDLDLGQLVQGVAMIPGTGEYSLAQDPVHYSSGPGHMTAANLHSPSGLTDFATSVRDLTQEVPRCGAVSLVVSWFGGDLRCGSCALRPKVEHKEAEGAEMPWSVSGLDRASAQQVILDEEGRPLYGGTPTDASVVSAIRALQTAGKKVMFYPFILMDQQEGNDLENPWTGGASQPPLPWRGRITLSVAPGQPDTPDQSPTAAAEVSQFMGTAQVSDFAIGDGVVSYSGPQEWSFRRFILHYAALCAAAGGVEAFCIGSEMRGLTQIRDDVGFPAVTALRALAADVRQILGPETKISYAADWSEYWGYTAPEGDRYFHLDPLWADETIDFIGIDNYMPLSDWREEEDHLDAKAGVPSIYDLDYLRAGIEGGEGYDWYYHSPQAEAAQNRTPITDGAHDEPWIWRYKDLRNWWLNDHHDRVGGVRSSTPTPWVPQSKPIWFTELGCAAIDKGTNQPNKFLDPKSSESRLPKYSNGRRDDLIQVHYLKAVLGYWGEEANNPQSSEYEGRMLDMANAYVWTWDARPFPAFPTDNAAWSDGGNYLRGHWLNGRVGQRTLASVVKEICARAGVQDVDVSQLQEIVRGYVVTGTGDARAALQPLMLQFGFDVVERDGRLTFKPRKGARVLQVPQAQLVQEERQGHVVQRERSAEAERVGRVRLRFTEWGTSHNVGAVEAVQPDEETHWVSENDMPLVLTRAEAQATVERWLAEARIARDSLRVVLPPSRRDIGVGDVIALENPEEDTTGTAIAGRFRIDRVEHGLGQSIEATRMDPATYRTFDLPEAVPGVNSFAPPVPVFPLFLDVPLLTGDEVAHAPHLALTAQPWPGSAAVYASAHDENYRHELTVAARAVVGVTQSPLKSGPLGRWDLSEPLQIKLISGALESREQAAVLNGANVMAIGDGSSGNWEILQSIGAELVAPGTYLVTGRLRGQRGTGGNMPEVWPEGSYVVLMDDRVQQLDVGLAQLGFERHYRIGVARRPYDDPSYVHATPVFVGNGLRPYAPVHLRQRGALGGDVTFHWIRCTRLQGDSWELPEVPLAEEGERYRLRILRGGTILREETTVTAGWIYDLAAQTADGVAAGDQVEVAQLSALYGAGHSVIRTLE